MESKCLKTTNESSFEQTNDVLKSTTATSDSTANTLISSASEETLHAIQINSTQKKSTISSGRSFSSIMDHALVIWLDWNTHESDEDHRNTFSQLRHIFKSICTFTDPNECINFITDIKGQKAFLILSDIAGEIHVPWIHDLSQIHSIYVFCDNKNNNQVWIKDWKKVKGIFTDISLIGDQLKKNLRHYEHDLTPISVISATSSTNLNELDQSFMYSQLLKEILLSIEHHEQSKRRFVNFLQNANIDDNLDLNIVNEFERDYERSSAILWYTRDCFIYSMINKALRTQDIEIIIQMGFFVRDLHQQIERLHSESNINHPMVVYRGQGMFNAEFDKLSKSKGGLLSFNNFLSTSIDRQISLMYAESSRADPNLTGILFRIDIDPSNSSTPFAALDNSSYFSDIESEILFSMHAVFRIRTIEKLEDRLWQVNLTLTVDSDEQLKCLSDSIRKEIGEGSQWYALGHLMVKMAKYDKAEEIYKALLELTHKKDSKDLGIIYHQLGFINFLRGYFPDALSYYEKTLEIFQKILPPNHSDLTILYNNFALVYGLMRDYKAALSYHEKVLEIRQHSLPPDHPHLAATYNNISTVYNAMKEYKTALSYAEKALAIGQKSLPPNHPDLATTYSNINAYYQSIGDYSTLLSNHNEILEIQQKSLPPDHPDLARTYYNLGAMYDSMGAYSTAIGHYKKGLEVQQKSLPSNHPDTVSAYESIGKVYDLIEDHSNALSYYKKAVDIQEKTLPSDHPHLVSIYNNIGVVYRSLRSYSNALST